MRKVLTILATLGAAPSVLAEQTTATVRPVARAAQEVSQTQAGLQAWIEDFQCRARSTIPK